MPSHINPQPPRPHQHSPVKVECGCSRPASSGLSDDKRPLVLPLEMVVPPLPVRMIKRHQIVCVRIRLSNALTLSQIAVPTGEAEVGWLVITTKDLRDDVINGKAYT